MLVEVVNSQVESMLAVEVIFEEVRQMLVVGEDWWAVVMGLEEAVVVNFEVALMRVVLEVNSEVAVLMVVVNFEVVVLMMVVEENPEVVGGNL
jgi:hypothetical protein